MNIDQTLAQELGVNLWQVQATIKLLKEGNTVPFIARYRKETTGSLTDTQLRDLEERHTYLEELEERKQAILKSIEEQGKLDDKLSQAILSADNKARLEDLYLPYKPKRRTKAQIAKEANLEPLALGLLEDPNLDPLKVACEFLNEEKNITSVELALEGARYILAEKFSEDADLLLNLRDLVWNQADFLSQLYEGKEKEALKFKDYFDYREPLNKVPSHRALAVFRGQKEKFLKVTLQLKENQIENILHKIAQKFHIKQLGRAADAWLWETIEWTWKIKLKLKIDLDLLTRVKEEAEAIAIQVFNNNLKNLLMSAPAGNHAVMGLDPGLRTGVKVAVIDGTGKLLAHTTIYPHPPKKAWDESIEQLATLCKLHQVKLISIGNGTASRETDFLVADLIKKHPELKVTKIIISEAGASVYSASKLASEEFPELDVSLRGAVSIARRLQDPLAELVKIDPKSIGVGQYQHDVNQVRLEKGLHAVLEDCVNAVGADVNTASIPLLKSIAGLNEGVASQIVSYREQNGPFKNRQALKKVSRFGEKTYEQAIGFLRIIGGENPLDASAVHPESYSIVETILETTNYPLDTLMGNEKLIDTLSAQEFITSECGLPTVIDILNELKKPGRDPRPEFKMPKFAENVQKLEDLKIGMILEGSVTNVTHFGAFVDIGVHQDGLVHISQLSCKFIANPQEVIKVGQIVTVQVIDVDLKRQRIQLSMKLESEKQKKPPKNSRKEKKPETTLGQALFAALKK